MEFTLEICKCLTYSIIFRAYNLRRMRLVNCGAISDKGLSEAVRKLPLLEELDISNCNLSRRSVKVVGLSCPLLKSFKYSRTEYLYLGFDDDEIVVIAETMPGLLHLDIKGNSITDVGLTAILDGCPRLESLDVRLCFSLVVSGSLRKRCFQQIKQFLL